MPEFFATVSASTGRRNAPADGGDASPVTNDFPLGFLDNTEWKVVGGTASDLESSRPRLALWFRFTEPPAAVDAAWHPALLAIPGDSLGSALVVALGGGDSPVGCVSLQIDLTVHSPILGRWVGVDSTCSHIGDGLASGTVELWSEHGEHVATVTQTAMLRGLAQDPTLPTVGHRAPCAPGRAGSMACSPAS